MKKNTLLLLCLLLCGVKAYSFCGFYAARSDVKLFNKTSQVILVRNGERTTVTMSSDFQGNVRDFAMVIPVPTILQEQDIRVTERRIFDQLDAYSAPRLAEYFDEPLCQGRMRAYPESTAKRSASVMESDNALSEEKADYKVAVLARYTVGEYDIEILNAQESSGLERWLNDHGYKIPDGAEEVLEPYIRSNMKFFVVKVNLEHFKAGSTEFLRPLQIRFSSPKFMLPIRLGMANGEGSQDMIVYSFTKNGRIETTNYRSLRMPTDRQVPVFTKENFGAFYTALYKKNLQKEGADNVFLEYAWDISGQSAVKCDPCPSQPPLFQEILSAGVDWLQSNSWGQYSGSLFFTRLHVTYNRIDFPQDLVFQETPDRSNFQCRYVIRHPAPYTENCSEWNDYQSKKIAERKQELRELQALTGWDVAQHRDYPYYFNGYRVKTPRDERTGSVTQKSEAPEKTAAIQVAPAIRDSDTSTLVAVQQQAFIPSEKSESAPEPFPYSTIAMLTVTGLFLYHRFRS